jgi:hypothetical protein
VVWVMGPGLKKPDRHIEDADPTRKMNVALRRSAGGPGGDYHWG